MVWHGRGVLLEEVRGRGQNLEQSGQAEWEEDHQQERAA